MFEKTDNKLGWDGPFLTIGKASFRLDTIDSRNVIGHFWETIFLILSKIKWPIITFQARLESSLNEA